MSVKGENERGERERKIITSPLPARVANQKVGFALSYRLAQPAINIDNMAERTKVKPQRQIHCRANKFYHLFLFQFCHILLVNSLAWNF